MDNPVSVSVRVSKKKKTSFFVRKGINVSIQLVKHSSEVRVCACTSPFVSAHRSERTRVGQLRWRHSGASGAVSDRALTLIATHTHECTHVHFLKGASQHVLRTLGVSTHTTTTVLRTPTDVHTPTASHTQKISKLINLLNSTHSDQMQLE